MRRLVIISGVRLSRELNYLGSRNLNMLRHILTDGFLLADLPTRISERPRTRELRRSAPVRLHL
ncbi:hypothetical protein ES705_44155 [subsurface metagenome]